MSKVGINKFGVSKFGVRAHFLAMVLRETSRGSLGPGSGQRIGGELKLFQNDLSTKSALTPNLQKVL
jgi:hypothetical protein